MWFGIFLHECGVLVETRPGTTTQKTNYSLAIELRADRDRSIASNLIWVKAQHVRNWMSQLAN
jgi:hypothetical protein